jgi:Cu/Ag efflux pump CusA
VIVWGVPELRDSLTDIEDLLISTPSGEQVTLGELADVRIAPTPVVIKRDVVSRFVDVAITVDGRDVTAVASDIRSALLDISFPLEYHLELLGASQDNLAAQQRVINVALAAVIGSFLLLQAMSGRWRLAFMMLITLPMALSGGLIADLLTGGLLTLGSLFGFYTILGIAVRSGILLIQRFQDLEKQGRPFGIELILAGAGDRLVPVLLTTVATGLFFLPLIMAGDIAGYDIIRPMAIVILGGLVTSLLLNLFIVPVLYLRFGTSPRPETSSPDFDEEFAMGPVATD